MKGFEGRRLEDLGWEGFSPVSKGFFSLLLVCIFCFFNKYLICNLQILCMHLTTKLCISFCLSYCFQWKFESSVLSGWGQVLLFIFTLIILSCSVFDNSYSVDTEKPFLYFLWVIQKTIASVNAKRGETHVSVNL